MIFLSSGFEAFREVLERRASSHPFENVQSLLPPNPWLGVYPVPGELKVHRGQFGSFSSLKSICCIILVAGVVSSVLLLVKVVVKFRNCRVLVLS